MDARESLTPSLRQRIVAIAAALRSGTLSDNPTVTLLASEGQGDGVVRLHTDTVELVVKVSAPDVVARDYMVRECHAAQWASERRMGPEVLYVDTADGVLATAWLPVRALTVDHLHDDAMLTRLGHWLRALHQGDPIDIEQDLRADIEDEVFRAVPAMPRALGDALVPAMARGWREAASRNVIPVCCHNDLHPENLYDVDGTLVAIDWAAAAMGDPAWDLASILSSATLDDTAGALLWDAATGAPFTSDARVHLQWHVLFADAYNLGWYTNQPAYDPGGAQRYALRVQKALDALRSTSA